MPACDKHFLKTRMHVEVFRDVNSRSCYVHELFRVVTSVLGFRTPLRELHSFPLVSQTSTSSVMRVGSSLKCWLKSLTSLIFSLKVIKHSLLVKRIPFWNNMAFSHKLFRVSLRWSFARSDFLVHKRLSEAGFVNLVVAVESVADHVDENVFVELFPVSNHEFTSSDDSFGVIRVYSQDRHAEWLHDVRSICEAAIIFRVCRESDLVVCNNVNSTFAFKLGQLA